MLCPSLTFDHRALDGGDVVRYLAALTTRVEQWTLDDYLQDLSAELTLHRQPRTTT